MVFISTTSVTVGEHMKTIFVHVILTETPPITSLQVFLLAPVLARVAGARITGRGCRLARFYNSLAV